MPLNKQYIQVLKAIFDVCKSENFFIIAQAKIKTLIINYAIKKVVYPNSKQAYVYN
jgi:hypothetical protein